jgi:serine/threonine protein phosphatase 1
MIYAMSDIHGCLEELKEQMKYVDLSGNNRLIFLGDYIDYGPDSGQVLRYIYNLQKGSGKDKVIVLKGNHEAMFLEWIDEFGKKYTPQMEMAYDSWLKTDSEHRYNVFKTLVTEEQLEEIREIEKKASFAKINAEAVRMVNETNGDLVKWMKELPLFHETEKQIYVHAGVDEEAEEYWSWGSGEEIFLWQFPAKLGKFYKTIVAGHVGTGSIAKRSSFHDVYFDGKSHYYIDGSVYKHGKLLLLAYDEEENNYYQIEQGKRIPVRKFDKYA